jgi:FixJ family two-component response regulator
MAGRSHGKVLVVDDDDGMREAIEALLEVAGYSPTVYASAEALLASNAATAAACIVSDIRLPAMSGLELLARLKAGGVTAPVIVITAHDAPGMREDALRRGAAAYLAKPFLGSALLDAIRAVTPRTAGDSNASP